MKFFLPIITFALLIISCNSGSKDTTTQKPQVNNPFQNIAYDSVVAYDYEGSAGKLIVDDSDKLAKTIYKSVVLPEPKTIAAILGDPASYGGDMAACFDPHLGIVYYKNGKPAHHVSICLSCNSLSSTVTIPFESGFSESGFKRLFGFCKALGFEHSIE